MAAHLPNPVVAPPHVHELLDRLHARSAEQEAKIDSAVYKTAGTSSFDDLMRDKFVALDQDKSQFVYQVARMTGATSVVEAGTSFGVSTIYLALAVGQNVADGKAGPGKVIATEKEPEKIKLAKAHWMEVGQEVEPYIELREGDLLQTLSKDLPDVDLLLLDSKYAYISLVDISRSPSQSMGSACPPYPEDRPAEVEVRGCGHRRQHDIWGGEVQGPVAAPERSRKRLQQLDRPISQRTGCLCLPSEEILIDLLGESSS